jgi:hypothetical protein
VRVNWKQVPQPVYDDMVSTLLNREHPTVERIDGVGGDGGRDVQFRENGQLHIFQLKSFTGRVSAQRPKRRSQVERSLAKAATHNPASWSLVVPIDPNPDELAWFDRLRAQYPFPLHWLGKTWLDDRMANYPDLDRYFLHDGDNEVVAVLRELGQEQAALAGGAPDALERFRRLSKRLDEVSPHYRFDLARQGDGYMVTAVPKYRGAERDRPILLHTRWTFPDTEAGREARERIARFFDYGGEIEVSEDYLESFEVDAPAGFGGTFHGGWLKLSSIPAEAGLPLDGRLLLLDPSDRPVASLPVRFDHRIVGNRGGMLTGQDVTQGLQLRIQFDATDHRATLHYTFDQPTDVLPDVVLPLLRFAAKMHAPNRVVLRFGELDFGPPHPMPDQPVSSQSSVELFEDLALIQARTMTPFTIPENLTRADLQAIKQTADLLRGERVVIGRGPVNITMTMTGPEALKSLLEGQEQPHSLAVETEDSVAEFADVKLPLGPATTFVRAAVLDNRDELQRHGDVQPGAILTARFVPVDGDPVEMMLGHHLGEIGDAHPMS